MRFLVRHREALLAFDEAFEQLGAFRQAQHRAGEHDLRDIWRNDEAAAELLHEQQRFERAAEAAQLVGRADREPAQLGELRPLVGARVLAGGEPRDAVFDEQLLR